MAKILVTGGTGYIGSHLVAELAPDHDIFIIDNFSNSYRDVLPRLKQVAGVEGNFTEIDIQDSNLPIFLPETEFDFVIHTAGMKAVGESVLYPLKYYENNVAGTINLLKRIKTKRLIFSSSATVYGEPDELPLTESSPVKKATSPYGQTKIMCENIIEDWARSTGTSAIIFRYFNPAGSHPSGIIMENPKGSPNNIFPIIVDRMNRGIPIDVFGGDYDTPDGTCVRDYIHIMDLVNAHKLAIEKFDLVVSPKETKYYNLGTGTGYSVLEILRTYETASTEHVKYTIVDRRPGDVPALFASYQKAKEELGWEPKLSLADICNSLL